MEVKIKRLSDRAVIPKYSKPGDAGLDLTATSEKITPNFRGGYDLIEYGTDLAFEIPEGHVGLIYPRSSLSKYDLILSNHVGVIDSGYRGEVKLKFRKTGPNTYLVGDRIGQLIIVPYPKVTFVEVDDLTETDRGDGGFGHTGA